VSDDDDELTARRGKPPTPRNPVIAKLGKKKQKKPTVAERKLRDSTTVDAIYFLTPRELRWCRMVTEGVDPNEAVRLAGWRSDGDRARMRAWRLKQKPIIRAALHKLASEAMIKAGIESGQVVTEWARLALMPDFMLEGKPRWSDKMSALSKLAEMLKLIDRNKPSTRELSIIQLITNQIASPLDKVVKDVKPEQEPIDVPAIPS